MVAFTSSSFWYIITTSIIVIIISFINTEAAPVPHHNGSNHSSPSHHYNTEQFDTIYDEKQNGVENIRFNIDRASVVWTSNSLLGLAALLEPALYDNAEEENKPNHFEIHLGAEDHGTNHNIVEDIVVTHDEKNDEKLENNNKLSNDNKNSAPSVPDDHSKLSSIQKRENSDGDQLSLHDSNQFRRYKFPALIRTLLMPKTRV